MAKIIALIGIDGSGKTTCATLLAKTLKSKLKRKARVIYGGNTGLRLGKRYSFYLSLPLDIIIHRILRRDHNYVYKKYPKLAKLETLLLAINYLLLIALKVILYSKLYDIVIADRYVYDLIVSRIAVNAHMKLLTRLLYRVMPKPDLTILLDVDEHVAYKRKQGEKDLYELKLLRKIYLHIAEKLKWEIMNANKALSFVFIDLWSKVSVVMLRDDSGDRGSDLKLRSW